MRLQLTKRGDYAVRACVLLAAHGDASVVSSRQIAQRMDIPGRFLPQVLADLHRAGLVQAENGKLGGYRLARRPEDLSLLEVIESVEGPMAGDMCLMRQSACDGDGRCVVHPTWSAAQRAFLGVLAGASLADLAAAQRGLGFDGASGPPGPEGMIR